MLSKYSCQNNTFTMKSMVLKFTPNFEIASPVTIIIKVVGFSRTKVLALKIEITRALWSYDGIVKNHKNFEYHILSIL